MQQSPKGDDRRDVKHEEGDFTSTPGAIPHVIAQKRKQALEKKQNQISTRFSKSFNS